jgi:hypothetical protein
LVLLSGDFDSESHRRHDVARSFLLLQVHTDHSILTSHDEATLGKSEIAPILEIFFILKITAKDICLGEKLESFRQGLQVVPKGTARIRTQISAAHTTDQLDQALKSFTKVRRKLSLI